MPSAASVLRPPPLSTETWARLLLTGSGLDVGLPPGRAPCLKTLYLPGGSARTEGYEEGRAPVRDRPALRSATRGGGEAGGADSGRAPSERKWF